MQQYGFKEDNNMSTPAIAAMGAATHATRHAPAAPKRTTLMQMISNLVQRLLNAMAGPIDPDEVEATKALNEISARVTAQRLRDDADAARTHEMIYDEAEISRLTDAVIDARRVVAERRRVGRALDARALVVGVDRRVVEAVLARHLESRGAPEAGSARLLLDDG